MLCAIAPCTSSPSFCASLASDNRARRELPRQRARHDRDAGELLAEIVVEIMGDPLALVVTALEHFLFERSARREIARARDRVVDHPPEQKRAQLILR